VGAGATGQVGGLAPCAAAVSILTRPWGRVQHAFRRERGKHIAVSILTRPWGRVQRQRILGVSAEHVEFQSSPARGGGCNVDAVARRGGLRVSILTRPWGGATAAAV